MIRIDRATIDAVATAIGHAMLTATTRDGLKIAVPSVPQKALDIAALLAIQSVTMAVFGANDVATPSDVYHYSNFPKGE